MPIEIVPEYERLCDLMDEYFTEIRAYNRHLGAFDMTPNDIRDARRREALNYARVLKAKRKLQENGIIL